MDIEHVFDHGEQHRQGRDRLDDPSASPTIDELESMAGFAEREIGRLRALQILMLRSLDEAGVTFAEGLETYAEWIAGRLDIDAATATDLATAMLHMPMDLVGELQQGAISFDRALAETRLEMTGVDATRRAIGRQLDVRGVNRLAGQGRRLTSEPGVLPSGVLRGEPLPPRTDVDRWEQRTPEARVVDHAPTVVVLEERIGDVADTPATTSSGHVADVSVTMDLAPIERPPGRDSVRRPGPLGSARRHPARQHLSSIGDD